MSDFSNIIQEINTNLPDNNTQSITAVKLRTTLIDLTNAIETEQTDFEEGFVVNNLDSTETGKSLSAEQGRQLKLMGATISIEGNDDTAVKNYVYCYVGHKYRIYVDNTEPGWSNISYTSSSNLLFEICVVDESDSVISTLYDRGCNDKVTPLQNYYDIEVSSNGLLRIRLRANVGSTIKMYVCDITALSELDLTVQDINRVFSSEIDIDPVSTITSNFWRGEIGDSITTGSSSSTRGGQYSVTPGQKFNFFSKFTTGTTGVWSIIYTNSDGTILYRYGRASSSVHEYTGTTTVPENASYLYHNYSTQGGWIKEVQTSYDININELGTTVDEHTSQITEIGEQIDTINQEIDELNDNFQYVESEEPLEYDTQTSGQTFRGDVGDIIYSGSSTTTMRGRRYPVNPGLTYYLYYTFPSSITGFYTIRWTDEDEKILKVEERITSTHGTINGNYIAPENSAYLYINYHNSSTPVVNKIIYGTADIGQMAIDIDEIKDELETISNNSTSKLMKVVISYGFSPNEYSIDNAFYIRTKYSETQDIIIQNRINSNNVLGFYSAFVGPNTLSDNQLRSSTYRVCSCSDSTAPIAEFTLYWHLYAQHGVPIPTISNNVGMTELSVGSVWQDTVTSGGEPLVRQYHIGYVDSSTIYLLPVFYEGTDGRITRDWKNKSDSPAITSLEFVSAGTGQDEGIGSITVTGYDQVQKRPILQSENRKFYCDNVEITEPGTYYCDEFKASESQIGYNPATIPDADWFNSPGERISLSNAEPLVNFTWSYLYKGASCAMNTTIHLLGDVRCQYYGAIQQQYFHNLTFDGKTYTAKFLIPKCKKNSYYIPFTEPNGTVQYFRTTSNLVDVNDPVDRQIGWLENTSGTNDFRVGLAAGLSLVTGDTVKEKRIINIPEGDRPPGASSASGFWRLGSISPDNANKFYIAAINAAPYYDRNYNMPAGMFKEINCYVSYFDPSANLGQVYWYKDGNNYIIYCHSQEAAESIAINVPEYMEGLQLSVVEKTDNATLLTSTITNGKFFITYTGDDQVKYIVLKAH